MRKAKTKELNSIEKAHYGLQDYCADFSPYSDLLSSIAVATDELDDDAEFGSKSFTLRRLVEAINKVQQTKKDIKADKELDAEKKKGIQKMLNKSRDRLGKFADDTLKEMQDEIDELDDGDARKESWQETKDKWLDNVDEAIGRA